MTKHSSASTSDNTPLTSRLNERRIRQARSNDVKFERMATLEEMLYLRGLVS